MRRDEAPREAAMPFRFVHAADIHLDSPLRSLALRDPALGELIGNATRRAFVAIVDLCLEEKVDALLIAGDLYDGDQTSMKTARFLSDQIRRLDQAGVRTFMIRGNHDALSKITKELTFPDSVKLFGGRAEAILLEPGGVAIHGISFAQPHAPESLLPKFKPPIEGLANIALLHTSLAGAPGHDRYAPCSIADLDRAGFDYWALGHVHARAIAGGRSTIVMPGMPQGRDVNEAGAKSVTLVTVADDRTIAIEERRTSVAQFERVAVDLTGVSEWSAAVGAVTRALEGARARAASRHLVARLSLHGATPLAWRLRRDADLARTEAEAHAAAIGETWIEALDVACGAPAAGSSGAADPLSELRTLIATTIAPSSSFQGAAKAIVKELEGQLPPECRGLFGADEAAFNAILADLAREGAEDVLARLHGDAAGGG
jgi:exonuclease SbcD